MVFLSLFGNGLVLAAILVPVLFFGDRKHFAERFFVITAAVVVGALVNEIIKGLVARPRPLLFYSDQIASGSVWVHTVFERWKHSSFPSGHTQTAFGAATALTCYWRGWFTPLIFALACGVGLSRIYLGVHFPLDVAAGALVGVLSAVAIYGSWEAVKRIYVSRGKTARGTTPG